MTDATTRRVIEIDAKIGGEALTELRRLQQLTKASEDSIKSLQNVAQTLSGGFGTLTTAQARFSSGLQQQLRSISDARQQLLQYQSAELGLISSTDDLVAEMVNAQKAIKAKGDAEQQGVAATNNASAAEAARAANAQAFITSLSLQQESLGKTAAQLTQMQSAVLAALGPYDQLRASIQTLSSTQLQAVESARALAGAEGQLSAEQLRNSAAGQQLVAFAQQVIATEREQVSVTGRLLDLNAELARSEAEAAAADKRHSDAGQQLLATLREQIDALRLRNSLGGREPTETRDLVQKSLATGVSGQAGPLIGELREQQDISTRLAESNRELTRTEAEVAAADKKHSDAGQELLATLREENALTRERLLLGRALTPDEETRSAAHSSGVGNQVEEEIAQRKELAPLMARQLDLERELARTEDEASAAEHRRSEAGQQLLATIRAENAALRERLTLGRPLSADEELQTSANASGVGQQVSEEIKQRNELAPLIARQADLERDLARSADEAAAADKRHSDAGQQLLATLREQIATQGLTQSQKDQRTADQSGVGPQAEVLIAERDAGALATAEKDKATAASKLAADASTRLQAELQKEIDTWGRDRLAIIEQQAAIRGESAAYAPLISQIRALEKEKQREADIKKASNIADNEAKNALKNLKASQDAFEKSLRDTSATYQKSQADILRYRAAQLQVSASTKQLVEDVIKQNKELSKVPEGGHGSSLAGNSGIFRELLVLTHETSQGQFKRAGGSLLVLAEYFNIGKILSSGFALSVIGVSGAVLALTAAMGAGAIQAEQFNKSIFLTGNFAGQTADSFKILARDVAISAGITIGSASEISEGLIATGRFGPEAIKHVAVAIGDLTRLTSDSAEDVVKNFAGMADGVAAWAKKSNEQYHFLDSVVFDHIRLLESQGRAQEAMIITSDKLHEALDKQKEGVSSLADAFRGLRGIVSDIIHGFEELGKPKSTGQLLNTAQTELSNLTKSRDESSLAASAAVARAHGFTGPQVSTTLSDSEKKRIDAEIASTHELIKGLIEQKKAEEDLAAARASDARVSEESIKGGEFVRSELEHNKGGNRAEVATRKLLDAVAAQRREQEVLKAAGKAFKEQTDDANELANHPDQFIAGDAIIKAQIAYYEKRDQQPKSPGQKAQDKLDNAVEKRLADLGRETAATVYQIEIYKQYGEAIDKAARAKVDFDIKAGTFKGKNGSQLSDSDADALRTAANKDDAAQRVLRGVKEEAEARKRLGIIKEEADANATNEREKQIATETANLGLSIEIEKRKILAGLIKEAINARNDRALGRQLTQDRNAIDEQIAKLEIENDLLGLNSIERTKALAALKLEAEARKLLIANPNSGDAIWVNTARNIEALTAAMQRNYDEQRKFEVGAKTAFTAYSEDATNAAKFSEKILGDALANTTDALATFYATGKFSLSKFLSSLAADFTTQIAKLQIKSLVDEPSIKSGIDKVLSYLQDLLFPAVQKAVGGFTLPTSSTPSANAGTVGNAQADFRASELAQQNAGSIVSGASSDAAGLASSTAATTAATTALTTFTTTGVTPAQAALNTFTGTGLAPSEIALGTFVGTGVTPAEAGLLSFVTTGISPAITALLQFTQSLLTAGAAAGASGSGAGIGSLFKGLFGSGSTASSSAGQFAGTTGYATGGIATPYGQAFLQSFAGGGLMSPQGVQFLPSFNRGGVMSPQGVSYLPSFAGGGVMSPAGMAQLLSFAYGGIMGNRGMVPISTFAAGGLMTPFGRLHPERYSDGGGITDRPRLAMFGEGRKPEAYVPLDDGKTMQVVVKQQHGQQIAYVPLPSGKSIPVRFNNEPGRMPMQAYADGGIHSKRGIYPAIRMYAAGGTSLDENDVLEEGVAGVFAAGAANIFESFAYGGIGGDKRKEPELKAYAYGGVGSASNTGGYHSLPLASFADGGWSDDEQKFSLPAAHIALPDGNVVPVVVKHWRGEATPFVATPSGTKVPASLLSLDVLHGKTGVAGAAGPGGFGGLFGAVGDDAAQALSGVAGNVAKQTLDGAIGGLGGVLGLSTPAGKGGFAGLAGAVGLTDFAASPSDAIKALTGFAGPAAEPSKVADAAAVTPLPEYIRNTAEEPASLLRRNKFAAFADGGVFGARVTDDMAFGMLPLQKFGTGGITDGPSLALFGEGRKKEAAVPLDDGRTMPVTVRYEAGGQRMFVPLPNGKAIPVTMKTDGFMKLPDGNTLPARAFADGGIMGGSTGGFDSVPLVRSQTINGGGTRTTTGTGGEAGGKGRTFISIENNGPPISGKSEESSLPNGDQHIKFIINAAADEVDRRIVTGGSTHAALKSKGVNMSGNLARRG